MSGVGGGLYSEVQCIKGSGNMGTPMDTQKHYLPLTSFAGCKYKKIISNKLVEVVYQERLKAMFDYIR